MVDADGDGIPLWGVETARAETFPCSQLSNRAVLLSVGRRLSLQSSSGWGEKSYFPADTFGGELKKRFGPT